MSHHAELLVFAPLRVEAAALRGAVPGARLVRTGMGPVKATRAVERWAADRSATAVAVAGVAGALSPALRPGDLVVASEVRTGDGRTVACSSGPLAAALRARGIEPHIVPIVSTEHLRMPHGRRAELASTGAQAVDMESAWLAAAAGDRPLAVLRAIVDTPDRPLWRPVATVVGGLLGLRSLRRAGPALASWADAAGPRTVLLAGPRSFCAGVERAIEIVEQALDRHGPPVYVRKQIVHNLHVVRDLERRGALFVDEIDEVPPGALTVFSAHGVSPEVRQAAVARGLRVIDATCPLVTKVHAEARRFAERGYAIVLVGHAGHEEVEGTTGEAPEAIRLIESAGDVDSLAIDDESTPVAYLTQTTLAVDEVDEVVEALRSRFPGLAGPGNEDICYATSNRQDAVRAIAQECDLVLVIGSKNSSNSRRLVEVSERAGCPARLIDDETELDPAWLAGAHTVGVTAGASAPESLVHRVVDALAGLGPVSVEAREAVEESVRFTLPAQLRGGR